MVNEKIFQLNKQLDRLAKIKIAAYANNNTNSNPSFANDMLEEVHALIIEEIKNIK